MNASPAIVAHSAARQLPRWALWTLCIGYVVPGYVGREAWKNTDVTTYALSLWITQQQVGWWNPSAYDGLIQAHGWLPYWLSAAAMIAVPFGLEWAYRLPYALALGATLFLTWQSVFRLSLTKGALPVPFAFGGQAEPLAYARSLADCGVLALMACLGLAQLSHEASPDVLAMAGFSTTLYALTLLMPPHNATDRKRQAWVLWPVGLLIMAWSGVPWAAVCIAVAGPVLVDAVSLRRDTHGAVGSPPEGDNRLQWFTWGVGAVTAGSGLWMLPSDAWATWALPSASEVTAFGRLLLWFAWPAWPLALWTLWRWRHHLKEPHMLVPLVLVLLTVGGSLLQAGSERVLMRCLPAVAVLAAFAMPTLRRSAGALIDWFSVVFFSFCALTVWVIWTAMMTGYPEKPAANVMRLAPGFEPSFGWFAFLMASAATLAWVGVVRWRVTHHTPALWRSLVLPTSGVVLCWLLLMSLWMPLLDHGRSYGPLARRMASLIPAHACAIADQLSAGQVSGLVVQGGVRLVPASDPNAQKCAYRIAPTGGSETPAEHAWRSVARVNRLSDRKESLMLYQRVETLPNPKIVQPAEVLTDAGP